jgi:hypothetical protein
MELSLHYETWIVLQLFLGNNQPFAKLTSSIIPCWPLFRLGSDLIAP